MKVNQSFQSQNGGVLIFVLICLFAILCAMAYVIDLNAYYVRKTQADSNAKIVALAALEEYYDALKSCTGDGCKRTARLQRALERANQVGKTNFILGDKAQEATLQAGNPSNAAKLVPGTWERDDTKCKAYNITLNAPCFIPIDPLSPPTGNPPQEKHPNAFWVSGALYPEGSKNYFADTFLGVDRLRINVDATASMVPRKGCFLVDISRSTFANTHAKSSNPDYNCAYEYSPAPNVTPSFYLPAGTTGSSNKVCCAPYTADNTGGYYSAELSYEQPDLTKPIPGQLDKAWACMLNSADRPASAAGINTQHYKSDYRFYELFDDSNYNSRPEFRNYHPDPSITNQGYNHKFGRATKLNWIDFVARPEPLTTIFKGIQAAVQSFKQRAVAGDDLCIVFFDQRLDWARVIKLTTDANAEDKFRYIERLTDFTNKTPIPSDPYSESSFDKIIKHGMFPGFYSDTNIQQAIFYATKEFSRVGNTSQGGVPSSNFLVLITDGLGNCRKCTSNDMLPGRRCYQTDSQYTCDQTFSDHIAAMNELKAIARNDLNPNDLNDLYHQRTPLHVILIGDDVRPNTMNIYNPNAGASSNGCYTDRDYRAKSHVTPNDAYKFVYGGTRNEIEFRNRSTERPYYSVNTDMYQIATSTGGIFGPIRHACNQLPPVCTRTTPPPPFFCSVPPPNCQAGIETPVFCDTENRSTEDQIKAYLEEIVSFNPYAIVDAK